MVRVFPNVVRDDSPGRQGIIVIGASGGGVEALSQLVQGLPADLPAAVFIVLHVSASSRSLLPGILDRSGPLHAAAAVDGEPIRRGRIYVAKPDHHLMIKPGVVRLSHAAKENRHRPAVDPLFRSAARAYGREVVGVILTGALDDGTAGLMSVKAHGGVAVVQDPSDAPFPSMPQNALQFVDVDHCLPLAEIPALLTRLAGTPRGAVGDEVTAGRAEAIEAVEDEEMDTGKAADMKTSGFTCPTCHGALWEHEANGFLRYECRIGHSFSLDSLLEEQSDDLESALWGAVRALEESAAVERRIAARLRGLLARKHGENATEKEGQARLLREMLLRSAANGGNGRDDTGTSQ